MISILSLILVGFTITLVREMLAEFPRSPGIWNIREPAHFNVAAIVPPPWSLELEESTDEAGQKAESTWNLNRSGDWLTATVVAFVGPLVVSVVCACVAGAAQNILGGALRLVSGR